MKQNKEYVIRVHENEFKYIKKESPVMRRLLKLYSKRQKRYAQIAKNWEKARPAWEAHEAKYDKQRKAMERLGKLMRSRRPAGPSADPLEKDFLEVKCVPDKNVVYVAWNKLINTLLESFSDDARQDYLNSEPPWRSFFGVRGRQWKLFKWHLGLTRINDFRRITPAELCALPGFGAGSVEKLMTGLKRCGITLGDLVVTTSEHASTK